VKGEDGEKGGLHVTVQHEHLLSRILHDFFAEVMHQPSDGDRLSALVLCGHGEGVLALVREEHLETAPEPLGLAAAVSLTCRGSREPPT